MEFESCINYLLTVTQHNVSQSLAERLTPFGITPGQYGVLNCLWEKGTCTPKEITQALRLESSTISGVLDRMQKRGLIDRLVDPNDRRSIRVTVTPEGESIREEVQQVICGLNREVLDNFTQEERDTLMSCLLRIADLEISSQHTSTCPA